MKGHKRIAVFFDANVFIQYQPITQVKWSDILGGEVHAFVVPSIIMNELDRMKDDYKRKRQRNRARAAINLIDEATEGDTLTVKGLNSPIEVLGHATKKHFIKGLIDGKADDELVAACLMYRETHPDVEVILVCHDSGPRRKARAHGIRSEKLPSEYLLPDEVDEQEKEIRQLRSEVLMLKNKLPKLKLQFEGGVTELKCTALGPFKMSDEEVELEVAEIQRQFPPITERVKAAKTILDYPEFLRESIEPYKDRLYLLFFQGIYDIGLERYDQELPQYYEQYRQYLKYDSKYQNLKRRTIEILLTLENVGSAIATEIDVFLHFPDGFELVDVENYPVFWPKPVPPERPETPEEFFQPIEIPDLSLLRGQHEERGEASNVSLPSIQRSNSYDVGFNVKKLKQKLKESFSPLFVVFESHETVSSFAVDYRINCSELPDEITGKLNVHVDRAES